MSKDDAIEAGLYQYIGEEIDVAYMEELKKQIIHPEIIKEVADELENRVHTVPWYRQQARQKNSG